jgi:hypothetical protein
MAKPANLPSPKDSPNQGRFKAAREAVREGWLDKRGLAEHYSCGIRSIEQAMSEGMPHWSGFGRPKFRVSEVEPWLIEHGYLRRIVAGTDNGAAPRERPAPDTEGIIFDAS